jgi:hypothetical protein
MEAQRVGYTRQVRLVCSRHQKAMKKRRSDEKLGSTPAIDGYLLATQAHIEEESTGLYSRANRCFL